MFEIQFMGGSAFWSFLPIIILCITILSFLDVIRSTFLYMYDKIHVDRLIGSLLVFALCILEIFSSVIAAPIMKNRIYVEPNAQSETYMNNNSPVLFREFNDPFDHENLEGFTPMGE